MVEVIKKGIEKARVGEANHATLYVNEAELVGENEFLFFIKPEITLASEGIALDSILTMILGRIESCGLQIKNINVLSADYLKENNIIAQHYGVINQIASDARLNLSEGARKKFETLYGQTVEEAPVLGGVEFLDKYPVFNPISLDLLWQNKENQKLAGGTYAEDIKLDGEVVYVINGFHPRQLIHFTEKGRSIVVFTLKGNLAWSDARNKLIGATNPAKAEEGSIRRTLLDNKEAYGLKEVSQGSNGVHLSAGPVEGLVELVRYNSNFTEGGQLLTSENFSYGQKLVENFTENQVKAILSNENVTFEGKTISIFDLTEEKNSDESIAILKKVFEA